jgi:hypothetical protein
MRREAEYQSKKFKNLEDIKKYFNEADKESGLIEALLFLASEIERVEYQLELLSNDYYGFDP